MALGAGLVVGPSRSLAGPCWYLASASPTCARSPRRNHLARSITLSAARPFQPKLAPSEVTSVLRNNEYTCSDLPAGPVKFFDTNTLQSNDPIEDSYASALTVGGGYLFGIFDGHGGAACGQVHIQFILKHHLGVNFFLRRWSLRGCYITLLQAC